MPVRTVEPLVADLSGFVQNSPLVEVDAVTGKCFNEGFCRTVDLPFIIGIFNAQIKNTAALMCQPFAYNRRKQSSEVNISRGGRCKARYFGTFRQMSGREALFHLFRRFGYVRKKEVCKRRIIRHSHI